MPADLPRIGVTFTLAAGLERLEYLGRGPWENYLDRQASAVVGRYESTVSGEYVPYIAPQEHGHHGDARWLRLTRDDGTGIEVRGNRFTYVIQQLGSSSRLTVRRRAAR